MRPSIGALQRVLVSIENMARNKDTAILVTSCCKKRRTERFAAASSVETHIDRSIILLGLARGHADCLGHR